MQEAFRRGKHIQDEQKTQEAVEAAIHEIGEQLVDTAREVKREYAKPRIIKGTSFVGATMPLPAGEPDEPILYAFIGTAEQKSFKQFFVEALQELRSIANAKVAVCVDMYDHDTWSSPESRPFHTDKYVLTDTNIFSVDESGAHTIPLDQVGNTIALFHDILQKGFDHSAIKTVRAGGVGRE